jgi:hypothetical protein
VDDAAEVEHEGRCFVLPVCEGLALVDDKNVDAGILWLSGVEPRRKVCAQPVGQACAVPTVDRKAADPARSQADALLGSDHRAFDQSLFRLEPW